MDSLQKFIQEEKFILEKKLVIVLSSLVFVLASVIISSGIKNIGIKNGNYVTVKGLSEKEVLSTSASWNLQYELGGNTIDEINKSNNANFLMIKDFFVSYGFHEDEINIRSMNFNIANYRDALYKYNAYISLSVYTKDINKMEQASKNIINLYNKGILFTSNDGPSYYFDKINDVKPEMLADSIKNALGAALEFAKNSGTVLGKIKTANQGYFKFLPVDRSLENHERYPKKILRVVTTVSYYLD
ncbi:SIMPL domain-containing protein [Borrelia miyamotoi]|uniref:SIMPL domain-containing protein n=2 Tax=Borrelia miyamotoi TaxID=47466 RepID=A0A481YIP5_9SPIR|nr:SIMPL domain-containing protein [Borrelia miyamotoi]MBW6186672.1 SIMPL domain-containing protein [Pseudomonas aeruginosa]QBK62682.1 SIMPL domain-containing protein [Borrelia miyamotoi]QBK63922.1 SIMPL domain-containing protein [Borrelia miyamotoi]QBK65206.1 SIMPL domain-containing protein [Borrelia miyamotoi]QBK66463.1 SIMPL domain-containing protein [Borrelia miyamotoi]